MNKLMTRVTLGLSLLGTLLSTAWAAPDPCLDKRVDDGVFHCRIAQRIVETPEGEALSKKTFGIVQAVTVGVELVLDTRQIDRILQEGGVQVPEQVLDITVETSGSPILQSIGVAPRLTITQVGDGSYDVTDAAIQARDAGGSLPSWVRKALFNYINGNPSLRQSLIDAGNQALSSAGL